MKFGANVMEVGSLPVSWWPHSVCVINVDGKSLANTSRESFCVVSLRASCLL